MFSSPQNILKAGEWNKTVPSVDWKETFFFYLELICLLENNFFKKINFRENKF